MHHRSNKKQELILLAVILLTCCYMPAKSQSIKQVEWLNGTWEFKSERGSLFEQWRRISVNEFAGRSYFLKGKDTVFLESIRIVRERDSLYYIPTVKNQNGALPVRFVQKSMTDKEFTFQNMKHDFPQLISYRKIGTDSLVAEISGNKKGVFRKEVFPMKKLKQ
jgi:hypothetical protein